MGMANSELLDNSTMRVADADWNGSLDLPELCIASGPGFTVTDRFPILAVLRNIACSTHEKSTLSMSCFQFMDPYGKHPPDQYSRMLHWIRK
jgi:hypothetical protein